MVVDEDGVVAIDVDVVDDDEEEEEAAVIVVEFLLGAANVVVDSPEPDVTVAIEDDVVLSTLPFGVVERPLLLLLVLRCVGSIVVVVDAVGDFVLVVVGFSTNVHSCTVAAVVVVNVIAENAIVRLMNCDW